MSVLRKICGITRRDRRRNTDVLKELNIEKDIVQVLQTRRLTYFGHVNRMQPELYPYVLLGPYMVILMVTAPIREDQGRSGSTTSVKTAPTWTFHYTRLPISLRTGRHGGTLFNIWLPTRGVIAIVATAVSQVSHISGIKDSPRHVEQSSWVEKTTVTWTWSRPRLWMYRNDIWIGRTPAGDPVSVDRRQRCRWPAGRRVV